MGVREEHLYLQRSKREKVVMHLGNLGRCTPLVDYTGMGERCPDRLKRWDRVWDLGLKGLLHDTRKSVCYPLGNGKSLQAFMKERNTRSVPESDLSGDTQRTRKLC